MQFPTATSKSELSDWQVDNWLEVVYQFAQHSLSCPSNMTILSLASVSDALQRFSLVFNSNSFFTSYTSSDSQLSRFYLHESRLALQTARLYVSALIVV